MRFTLVGVGTRVLVYLRSISREIKRMNDLKETELSLAYPDWRKGGLPKPPKLARISIPSPEDWSKRYRETHGEETEGP